MFGTVDSVLVAFLALWQNTPPPQQKQLKEGRYVGTQFEGTLYRDKEAVVEKAALAMAGVWGNWPHCVPSQETEK